MTFIGKSIIIRKTRKSDIGRLAEILLYAFQTVYANKISDEALRESVSMQMENYKTRKFNTNGSIHYVATHENKVVAFVIGKAAEASKLEHYKTRGYAELMSISIAPEYQRKGVGEMLFDFIVKKFKELGYTKMVIGTNKDNLPARRAYEKWGCVLDTEYEKPFETCGHTFTEVFYIYDLTKERLFGS